MAKKTAKKVKEAAKKAVSERKAGKLRDQVALITGGDSGIGRAVSVAFAKEGADVAIVYLSEREDAGETKRLEGDVGDHEFCRNAVGETIDALGRLDILVNNAAEQHPVKEFEEITDEQLHRTFRTNIFGYFYMTGQVLHPNGGRIVNG